MQPIASPGNIAQSFESQLERLLPGNYCSGVGFDWDTETGVTRLYMELRDKHHHTVSHHVPLVKTAPSIVEADMIAALQKYVSPAKTL